MVAYRVTYEHIYTVYSLWVSVSRYWSRRLTNGKSWKARHCSTHTRPILIIYANATVFVCKGLLGFARCMWHGCHLVRPSTKASCMACVGSVGAV